MCVIQSVPYQSLRSPPVLMPSGALRVYYGHTSLLALR